MMKEKEMKRVPKLRFPEFTDDWEQRKFSDCYRISSGYAFKMSDYCDDGTDLINGESIQHGIINDDNLKHLPKTFVQQYPDFVLKEGDIVVGLNRPITNGNLKIAKIPNKYNGSLLYQRAGKIVYKEDYDINFTYVLLSQEILKHTLIEAVGSDQPFISTSKLEKWRMMIPTDSEEQDKLGDYFRNLDYLITLHQRKLEKLKELRKGVMKKLFSQEVRFKADDGSEFPDWEEKKLGDDVQFINGRAYKQDELLNSGKYLVLRVGNLFTNDSYYYSDLELDNDKYIENGDLIYAWSATFGPRIYYGEKCIYHYHIWKLKFDENIISKIFLNYYLLYDVEKIKSQRTGGTMVHITKNAMEHRELQFPCLAEQQKIADCLSTLDDVIEKQKETLAAWEELKKGLLQQMFV